MISEIGINAIIPIVTHSTLSLYKLIITQVRCREQSSMRVTYSTASSLEPLLSAHYGVPKIFKLPSNLNGLKYILFSILKCNWVRIDVISQLN